MSLSSEAIENAARSVLQQLSQRLIFSSQQRKDEAMECLQFGICSIPAPVRNHS